jgi:hypothetical protein
MTIRAHFDGKVFVPVDQVDLPKDEYVEIEVLRKIEPEPGSPQAVLQAMRGEPHVSSEDVNELLRMIEEGKLSPNEKGVFDDLADE